MCSNLAVVQILFIYTYIREASTQKTRGISPPPARLVYILAAAVPVGASQAGSPLCKNQIKMLRHYMTIFFFLFLSAHLSSSDGFSIHFTFDVGERRRKKERKGLNREMKNRGMCAWGIPVYGRNHHTNRSRDAQLYIQAAEPWIGKLHARE